MFKYISITLNRGVVRGIYEWMDGNLTDGSVTELR